MVCKRHHPLFYDRRYLHWLLPEAVKGYQTLGVSRVPSIHLSCSLSYGLLDPVEFLYL